MIIYFVVFLDDFMLLKGRKVLITGATGGIGRAICKIFLQNGAELFITNISQESLEQFASELNIFGKENNIAVKVHYKSCDLCDKNAVAELVKTANNEMNGLDVSIGNAGMNIDTLTLRMTDEQWQKVLDVNLTANFILSRESAKIMMKQRYGRIINMASIVGITGNIGQANYSASKGGLIAMTKCFAQEYATRGITANCIAPGFIETPMTQAMSEEARKMMLEKIPMKKYGQPEDVAGACLFLASDLAKYITGEVISVNGGMLMR